MKRYPDSEDDKLSPPPPGFVDQIKETLGWRTADIVRPEDKKKRDTFVFGGRRRQSKFGVDGNPSTSDLFDTEAGAMQGHFSSPKSPADTSQQPFP